MEKTQHELCGDVLRRLKHEGVLDNVVLIGSWCGELYRSYFTSDEYLPIIRTRDVDFLVPRPPRFDRTVDLQEILRDMGFMIDFKGTRGLIRFEHPDLSVEFLVPERGRGSDKPFNIPELGVNAQPLRFLDVLLEGTVTVSYEDVQVVVPHPANFALHKLLISSRRGKTEKRDKDRALAVEILRALILADEGAIVTRVLQELPRKWQKQIRSALNECDAVIVPSLLPFFE